MFGRELSDSFDLHDDRAEADEVGLIGLAKTNIFVHEW